MATHKQAARLTGYAHGLGLSGTVYYRPGNGIEWEYQWCPPDASKTQGLGDTFYEARATLWNMAYWQDKSKA